MRKTLLWVLLVCLMAASVSPAFAHEMIPCQAVTAPTCTQEGQVASVCSICGYQENAVSIGKSAHSYVPVTVRSPGHASEGVCEIQCSQCGLVLDSFPIPCTSQHRPVVQFCATSDCSKPGACQLVCVYCDAVLFSQTIPAGEHHYVSSWTNQDGNDELDMHSRLLYTRFCLRCGDRPFILFPSLIVLIPATLALAAAAVVLLILYCKARRRRRSRREQLNAGHAAP